MALEQAILLGARAQIKNQELELILNLEPEPELYPFQR